MNYPVKIVGALLDVHRLHMYMESGETITIEQGDQRIRPLMAKLTPALDSTRPPLWRYYMLTAADMEVKNQYADTEQKTNGAVRFFKMLKSKVVELANKFLDEPMEPQALGQVVHEDSHKPLDEEAKRPLTKSEAAVAEIMANAVPASAPDFAMVSPATIGNGAQEDTEEMIVAVTSDNTIIPNADLIAKQISAVSAGVTSAAGFTLFMERAASVKRSHTVEDLLKFMEKGELPIADDGTVLVYKRLNSSREDGIFTDLHSGLVKQKVGSFVHMAPEMVDPNRSADCSHGLHVARRDYLRAFSGNVTVLCKLAPEDVIAVPHGDARKLRASGYHIIARLSNEDAALVCQDKPMKDLSLLARCVAGDHAPILEYVEIKGSKGTGLVVTPAGEVEVVTPNEVREVISLDSLKEDGGDLPVDARAIAIDLAKGKDKTVVAIVEEGVVTSVKEVPAPVAKAVKAKAPTNKAVKPAVQPKAKKVNQVEEMAKLVGLYNKNPDKANARAIYAFKQKSKKGWDVLGVTDGKFIKKITERAKL